jgi:hypothetical protein
MLDREANVEKHAASPARKRRAPSRRERGLIEKILWLEADGTDHTGAEIDQLLAGAAHELGYADEDVSRLNPNTGRSVFLNEGDWAKAAMTEERWHEVVGTATYWQGDVRRNCNIYRITPRGLEHLTRRG